jgi:putative oxidoreductase
MRLGMAVLRVVVGILFMGHGLQKLAGWFGGGGLGGTGRFFEVLGLRPGKAEAAAAGVSETAGGALLALGLLTPVGAAMVTGVMAVAIAKVHAPNGPWVANNGYEYNLVLMSAAFALAAAGPGEWSLDEQLGIARSGAAVGLAELGAGLAGAAVVVNIGSRMGEAADPDPGNGGSAA